MDELTFVGIHDDGTHLVLQDARGGRYRLAMSSALAAALHRRPLPVSSDSSSPTVTPRDVQAMIRAGASTDQVAEMSGWSADKVSRYEAPILAEREHVAALARAAYLPSFGRGPSPTLEKRAKERLVMRGLRPEDAWWDAWRQDGSPWAVSLSFEAGGRERRAVWHFDVLTSSLTPQDDEARWLSTAEEDGFEADAQQDGAGADEAQDTDQAERDEASTEHPLQDAASPDEDPVAEEAQPRGAEGEPEPGAATTAEVDGARAPGSPEPESESIAPRQRQPQRRNRRGRPSVPSWDDIMFGGPKG